MNNAPNNLLGGESNCIFRQASTKNDLPGQHPITPLSPVKKLVENFRISCKKATTKSDLVGLDLPSQNHVDIILQKATWQV